MKKLLAILCTAMLLVTCCIPVLAEAPTDGKITITNAVVGQDYAIYKLLDLSYDDKGTESPTDDAYTYTVNAAWENFFKTEDALTYVSVDQSSGAVTWVKETDDLTVAAFAKLALEHAKNNNIDATETALDVTATTVEFDALTYGYYLVDSTVGTLCVLNTTNKTFTKNEKNELPSVDKKVQEDDGEAWGTTNTAELGQVVNYEVTLNVKPGAENYVLHDTMTGLTFDSTSVVVKNGDNALTVNTDYTVSASCADNCSFEISFTKAYLDAVTADVTLKITYSATVNYDAVIEGDGNPNEVVLKYGENNDLVTNTATTTTYVYDFDLVKSDKDNTLLDGAIFQLSQKDATAPLYFVLSEGTYKLTESTADGATQDLVVTNGKVKIAGLDTDVYSLVETVAPEGYNKLTSAIEVDMSKTKIQTDATFTNADKTIYNAQDGYGVQVVNQTGTVLPETGGIGTTMFILVGGGLALCAGILLVTKKRMAKIAD